MRNDNREVEVLEVAGVSYPVCVLSGFVCAVLAVMGTLLGIAYGVVPVPGAGVDVVYEDANGNIPELPMAKRSEPEKKDIVYLRKQEF